MRLGAFAACLLLAGCSEVCPPAPRCARLGAVVIRVVDAQTEAPLRDAVVVWARSGAEAALEDCPDSAAWPNDGNCRALQEPGSYHLIVRAAGYTETSLDVAVSPDLCGHYASQIREVGLQKLGSAAQPLVDSSEGCGG